MSERQQFVPMFDVQAEISRRLAYRQLWESGALFQEMEEAILEGECLAIVRAARAVGAIP